MLGQSQRRQFIGTVNPDDVSFVSKRDGHSWKSISAACQDTVSKLYTHDRMVRAEVLWRKIKSGAIIPPASDCIARDYAKEFKKLEKQHAG